MLFMMKKKTIFHPIHHPYVFEVTWELENNLGYKIFNLLKFLNSMNIYEECLLA